MQGSNDFTIVVSEAFGVMATEADLKVSTT
jgi:hypothetical protein